jgi:hypothetical protein
MKGDFSANLPQTHRKRTDNRVKHSLGAFFRKPTDNLPQTYRKLSLGIPPLKGRLRTHRNAPNGGCAGAHP